MGEATVDTPPGIVGPGGRDRVRVLGLPDGTFRLVHERLHVSVHERVVISESWASMPPIASIFGDAESAESAAVELLRLLEDSAVRSELPSRPS